MNKSEFMEELKSALEALETRRLIPMQLCDGRDVCALGAVMYRRGIDVEDVDSTAGEVLDLPQDWCDEVAMENDEVDGESPEQRWTRMHKWSRQEAGE